MPSNPIYKEDTNTIDDIMANDIVRVSLKLQKTAKSYTIKDQTISVLRGDNTILGPISIKEKKGGSNQYQPIKGGLRRFSNSNRVNNRVIYNRTMSRRD